MNPLLSPLLIPLLLLLGIALLALAVFGRMLRPADGEWVELRRPARAVLAALGLLAFGVIWYLSGATPPRWGREPAPRVWTAEGGRSGSPEAARLAARAEQAEQGGPEVVTAPAVPVSAPVTAPASPAAAQPAGAAPAGRTVTAMADAPAALQSGPAATAAGADVPYCRPCDEPRARSPMKKNRALAGSAARRPRAAAAGDVVSVCELQQRNGILGPAPAASMPAASSGAAVTLRNALGPGQTREVLRVEVDGVQRAELVVSRSRPRASTRLRLPQGAGARYRLSGYTEYDDGRGRVPIQGEGWLDQTGIAYEVRVADADAADGYLFLEPSS